MIYWDGQRKEHDDQKNECLGKQSLKSKGHDHGKTEPAKDGKQALNLDNGHLVAANQLVKQRHRERPSCRVEIRTKYRKPGTSSPDHLVSGVNRLVYTPERSEFQSQKDQEDCGKNKNPQTWEGEDLGAPVAPMTPEQLGLPELRETETPEPIPPTPEPAPPTEFQEPTLSPLRQTYQPGAVQPPPQPALTTRDVEVILSKLDAIKAILTSLETRLAALERIASGQQQEPRTRW